MTARIQVLTERTQSRTDLIGWVRSRIDLVSTAHEDRCRHLAVTDADLKDIGIAREEAVAGPSHQPVLPFFMQTGFQADRS